MLYIAFPQAVYRRVVLKPHKAKKSHIIAFFLGFCCVYNITPPTNAETKPHKTKNLTFNFSINSGSLPDVLLAIGKQTGSTLIFPHPIISGTQSPEIEGNKTTYEAIKLALQKCECKIEQTGPHAFIIAVIKEKGNEEKIQAEVIEEIVVTGIKQTGSHLIRKSLYSNSSLITIDKAIIDQTSATSLHDLLKVNPAVTGATTSTAISNGGNGTSTVTLRGLPADITLVLVNGLRIAPHFISTQIVNLYSIPSFATNSIEIFKDGTSSVYGSDAIAGTVNIILDKELNGINIEQGYGETSRGDLETTSTTIKAGIIENKFSLYASAHILEQNGVYSRDREISRNTDTRSQGGQDNRSSASSSAFILLPDGAYITPIESDNGPPLLRYVTNQDLYSYQEDTSSISPAQRSGFYTSASYKFTKNLSGELNYYNMNAKSEIVYAPLPVFTSLDARPIIISAENQYNYFGIDLTNVSRRMIELSNRIQHTTTKSHFYHAALNADYTDYQWGLSYHYSKTLGSSLFTNLIDGNKLQRGLGPSSNCQGASIVGCTPINFLGPAGSITDEELNYIRTSSKIEGESILKSFNINYGADLNDMFNFPLLLAFGTEFREERSNIIAEHDSVDDFVLGQSQGSNLNGSRDIRENYAEIEYSPKLIENFHTTALELAFRYSHYDDFGENIAPRLGLRISPIKLLTFRTSYSESFHAPSLREINGRGQNSYLDVYDPCTVEENVENYPGCTTLADSRNRQILVQSFGNSELEAELSDSIHAGILWDKGKDNHFFVGLDYHQIKQHNVIRPINPDFLVFQQAISGSIPVVERNEDGALTKVRTTYLNAGSRTLTSYDTSVGFKYYIGNVFSQFRINATYIDKYKVESSLENYSSDVAGVYLDVASDGRGALPKWKFNMSYTGSYKASQFSYINLYVDELSETTNTTGKRKIDSWLIHNIQFQQTLYNNHLKLVFGVDNLLDTAPPFSASSFNDNYDARTHDIRGRYYYARLTLNTNWD